MRVKDLERTANVAWSPKNYSPILLATGTAAQQLDASFSTNAALEIYSLNLAEPGLDMKQLSSSPTEHRFHKLIWGPHGDNEGTIIGGCDAGLIQIYSASKLLKGENGLIGKHEKHSGPVQALDFNNFQQNLFATGAGNSEIFIWDLNNTNTPMTPGAKTQPSEDVLSVAWNRQVQHILASAFASRCVIWDLRKNEPIIKLTDTVSRIRWKVVAWHPEVATQLCLASEEDHSPIIQVWDLRFATSPLKTLENHQRGVLSMAWCSDDSDLLISCGKDNRILCWNPSSSDSNGEVLAEIAKTNQWSFDIAWCPRNPAIIASPNFDGHISIYSLMGGKTQQFQTTNKIADSFPGMEGYVQAPVPQQNPAPLSFDLTKPPKWLKRPVGASFGFGGKLITFENDKNAVAQAQQNVLNGQPAGVHRNVQISQVVTEPELVQKSAELEQALELGNFKDYCLQKADQTADQHKKYIWHYIKANFEDNPRVEILNLLGYKIEDINNTLNQAVGKDLQNNINNLNDQFSSMNRIEDFNLNNCDPISTDVKKNQKPFKIKTGNDSDGLITQAVLLGNVEAAVELCFKAKRYADAIIISMTGGSELLSRTQRRYLNQSEGYVSSLISALVTEDWSSIINGCDITSWKEALAATLTHSSDDDLPKLCELLGKRLEKDGDNKLSQDAQLCYICSGSFDKLVTSWAGNETKSTQELQELVELVMFLQKAIERQGRHVQISGALADLLSHYASLLASQGNLETALNYLGTSGNEKITSLRERLYVSLGKKHGYAPARQGQSRRASSRQSFSNYGQPFAPLAQPQNTYAPPTSAFNTGLPGVTTTSVGQAWMPQTNSVASFPQPARTFSPVPGPPPVQPPRPTSVGSSHGGGLPSRKYVLDPSVTSNSYGNIGISQPLPLQPANFQTNAISNPSPSIYSPQPNLPLNPMNPVPNPPLNPASYVPTSSYAHNPPHSTAESIQDNGYAANRSAAAPPGWNDPPMLHKSSKSQPKPDVPKQEPITHPIFGTAPAQTYPVPESNGYSNVGAPPLPFTPSYLPEQTFQGPPPVGYSQPPPTVYGGGGFNQNALNNTVNQQQAPVERVREAAPSPPPKKPIPEEHMHMKTVFDELRYQCSCRANNPQLKRKLDDVTKKLEALYDLLREDRLSPNTLTSLHQMVQMVQNGDYRGAQDIHTQLVSGTDFAQIASFMPGLKVLFQCALQLQIYLR